MRYGQNKSKCLEIDPAARRKPSQTLKKAAPGAPFGWTSDGRPYIGTQYRVSADGLSFASVSTRNGYEQEYWQPIRNVSAKVATSALETHGNTSALLGSEMLDAARSQQVRAHFASVLGEEKLQARGIVA